MSWPFTRRKSADSVVLRGLQAGPQRSPGFELVAAALARRPKARVLDLGQPSTENLAFLSERAENVAIGDLFRSCGGVEGERATPFRFPDVAALPLPEDDGPFDLILVWDLLHYFERRRLPAFAARLARLAHAGTTVFVIVSATTPIPPTPLGFKIEAADRLRYSIASESRSPAPHFTPREVEKLMAGFEPVRSFQLRSGLQELVFLLPEPGVGEGREVSTAAAPLAPKGQLGLT